MIDVKNVLEVINEILVLPIAIITFILLIYITIYLWKKDQDVIRSRIFLKYCEIKKAFILLAAFALVLILQVALIYMPHFFKSNSLFFIEDLQRILGLVLILILITFVYFIYRSMSRSLT
jgi:protein-S-isoprenylcysteine O-methyltransferase Ste14